MEDSLANIVYVRSGEYRTCKSPDVLSAPFNTFDYIIGAIDGPGNCAYLANMPLVGQNAQGYLALLRRLFDDLRCVEDQGQIRLFQAGSVRTENPKKIGQKADAFFLSVAIQHHVTNFGYPVKTISLPPDYKGTLNVFPSTGKITLSFS
ncbi:MAG: hypothetical protein HY832_00830 [Candidatus Aenigmarchaeota archaeon]|nr:hypothetical protein [Candidatus Aenigmarchaeota archaeon]